MSGPEAIKAAKVFLGNLEADGAFQGHGLDYGCGFGRHARIILEHMPADQLDLCDAWPGALEIVRSNGFENNIFRVPEVTSPADFPRHYDFAYSVSIFSHLAREPFENNLATLREIADKVYITVRHVEFAKLRYPERLDEIGKQLEAGIAFIPVQSEIFGDTMVSPEYMHGLGGKYVGEADANQKIYRFD